MEKAAFSIVNYQFDRVSINLENHKSPELSIDFACNGSYNQADTTYELTFHAKVFNPPTEPFVSIQCKGTFQFDNISDMTEIPDYFYVNSIAILFPYVRAYLSLVTTQANVPGIILPTLNLSHLQDELRRNTIQK